MKQLTMSAEKQELLIAFSTWKEVWSKRKITMVTVEMRRKTIQQATLRRYFFEWRHMMATQKTLERKTRKLIAQRITRLLKQRFEDWRANLSLNAALRTLLPRLNEIAVRVKVESGFTKWTHVVTLKKTLEYKERERQRRIMEFIMGRHEWNLERIFGAWQSYASSRRAKHAEAQKRLTARLTKLKSSTWKTWCNYILCTNIQKHLLSTLEKNLTAYHVRIAVSKWKRHIHHTLILKLQEHNAILSQENKRVSDESNLNAALVKDLQVSLVESDQHISHLETKLSYTSSTTSRFQVEYQRERDRTRALARLVSRNLVIKDVLQAFSRWKKQTVVISSQYASLETLERLLQRKQRKLAFQDWRRKTISAMKLQYVQQRRRKLQQMALMNTWKNYCRRNLRVKLVLMRLCGNVNMNAQEHGLSVLGAFRIWRKHSDAYGCRACIRSSPNVDENDLRVIS
uniref:Sfi1 spindle body domain-containing protein n=1 Tax=Globisporangium ultimum (strain ATCC 200006 / CBS 805.95 / DAOM BR144) TaxID=431595 RepID=K3X105_GLOUD